MNLSTNLSKKEYRKILGRLPIKNPTPEDMAAVCPHLTMEQAVEAFGGSDGSGGYVACPGLRVRGAFQIVSYHSDSEGGRLDWAFTGRVLKSYADGHSHGDIFGKYRYMEEAMKFAEENWGDELVVDYWNSALEIYVQDPSDLTDIYWLKNQPKTKAVLYITLNRDLNDIINDHSRPESELFDLGIAEMTLDLMEWHELKGGRGVYTEFNCAYCGSGLGLDGCGGCDHKFDDDQFRCGWSTPLSKKMILVLKESGHVFKKDVKIAWDKEKERHEKYKKEIEKQRALDEALDAEMKREASTTGE